jgi:dTDP-4-amino-4,6-dideoxygalactose transaminase
MSEPGSPRQLLPKTAGTLPPASPPLPPFVPLFRPWITDDELQAVDRVLRAGTASTYRLRLESDVSDYVGVRHAIGSWSVQSGVQTLLKALGIGAGDDVILPALYLRAVARAVSETGARIVHCDVGDDLTISPAAAAGAMTMRTRAIIGSHANGQPCAMAELTDLAQRYRIHLIEDGTHALGARYRDRPVGSFGIAAVAAFFPTDNFLTGDSAVILTDDADLARQVRRLTHDQTPTQMTELQAALAFHQLEKLELFLELRARHAESYFGGLADLPGIHCPALNPDSRPGWHTFPLRVDWPRTGLTRDDLLARLHAANVGSGIVLAAPPGTAANSVAGQMAERLVMLPLYARMTPSELAHVVHAIRQCLTSTDRGPRPSRRTCGAADGLLS